MLRDGRVKLEVQGNATGRTLLATAFIGVRSGIAWCAGAGAGGGMVDDVERFRIPVLILMIVAGADPSFGGDCAVAAIARAVAERLRAGRLIGWCRPRNLTKTTLDDRMAEARKDRWHTLCGHIRPYVVYGA